MFVCPVKMSAVTSLFLMAILAGGVVLAAEVGAQPATPSTTPSVTPAELKGFAPSSMSATTSAPATRFSEANVPQLRLDEINALFMPPKGSPEEQHAAFKKQMRQALDLGKQTEQEYPDAQNLYLVRLRMLQAAGVLLRDDPSYDSVVLDIANRLLDSKAPREYKLHADWFVLRERLTRTKPSPQEIQKQIQEFVERYADTPSVAQSLIDAALLASQLGREDLRDQYADILEQKYRSEPIVGEYLRVIGRKPNLAKTFSAEFTLLDGKKITLPSDLLGKVVILDFWTTTCPACLAEFPRLKTIYEKNKDRGLEIVSINLNEEKDRDKVQKVVKENGLTWPQAFSGKGWDDPVATKYGIQTPPSIWVIGADGKVISDSAKASLEDVLEAAFRGPTSQPAGAATSAPARP